MQRPRLRLPLLRLLLAACAPVFSAAAPPPNVIVILADDLGYSDLGCYGGELATPALDRLAHEGLRLTRFHNGGMCVVSRASLMTGNWWPRALPQFKQSALLPEQLRAAGYRTALIGKWHLPGHPLDRGFDHFFGFLGGFADHFTGAKDYQLDRAPFTAFGPDYYSSDAFTDRAIRFVRTPEAKKPFFLYLSFQVPHNPLQAPKADILKHRGRYAAGWQAVREARFARQKQLGLVAAGATLPDYPKNLPDWNSLSAAQRDLEDLRIAVYAAMVERMDRGIGLLLDALTAAGQADNTLILFMSDNGSDSFSVMDAPLLKQGKLPGDPGSNWQPGTGWAYASVTPWRLYKISQHSGGVTSGAIAWWPRATARPGRIEHSPVHMVDLLPTLLAAAAPTAPAPAVAGESFLPLLRGQPWRRQGPLYFQYMDNRAIRTAEWTLAEVDGEGWELFHTARDPFENTNLAARHPKIVADLSARWLHWWRTESGQPAYTPTSTKTGPHYKPQGDRGSGQPYVPTALPPRLGDQFAMGVSAPGHNSIVRTFDGQELFIVYHTHADPKKPSNDRVANIDRLEFTAAGKLRVLGPTRTPQPLPSAAPPRIAALRCEYLPTPLGLDDAAPALSWTIRDERRGVVQTAYRLLVASSEALLAQDRGDLWDSGDVPSDQSHLVDYAGRPLVSRQRCFWKVQVKTRAIGEAESRAAWSPVSWWEMGLLQPADWQGSWIQSTACQPLENETTALWRRLCLVPPELNDFKNNPAAAQAVRTVAQQKLDAVLPAPVFRATFAVPGAVQRARLYLSGLGFHEATLNGRPVGDRIHDPSVTQYKVRGAYVTHDVGALVQPGPNEISVTVGGGYFHEPVVWGNPGKVDGLPSLRAQLEVELTDGRRVVLATDKSWHTAVGPLLKTHYWAGEVFDARRSAGTADAAWLPATEVAAPVPALVAQRCEPERIIRAVRPVALTQPRPGIWVFDLGEVIVGTVRLSLQAPAGTAVVLRTAEWTRQLKIEGPKFAVSRLHYENAADAEPREGMIAARRRGGTFLAPLSVKIGDKVSHLHPHLGTPTLVYVARGAATGETWRPSFTLQPMRYIEVQGLATAPTLDTLTGLVVTSDEETVGAFTSGNPRFNDIFEACMNSTRYTTHGMSWDNAVERLQSQVLNAWSAPFASYLLWYPNLWRKILEDQRLINRPAPGPDQAFANVVYGARGGPGWAIKSPARLVIPESGMVELPMALFDRYGERRELRAHFPQMKAWLEACVDPATGKFRQGAFAGGWNDHFCIETAADSDFVPSFDDHALMGMMFYQWVRDTADAARLLGATADAVALDRMAQAVRDEVNRSFYDATNKSYGAAKEKRTGQLDSRHGWHGLMALAIASGVAPAADIPALLDHCIADMKAHYRGHHAAGHITHQLLYDAYSAHGLIETCYDMMNATGFPSFASQLQSGNRTIPEGPAWTDKFPAFASAYQNECQEPARWFTQTLCGVSPDRAHPGFKHVLLRPRLPARLPSASLTTTTPYGELESSWTQRDGTVTWTVRIPPNSHATAWIPARSVGAVREGQGALPESAGCRVGPVTAEGVECRLSSGNYRFQFPTPANLPSRLSELR